MLQIEQVSDYFQEVEKDQRWHCPKTNQDLAYGILAFYRTFGQVGLNGFSIFGLPRSGEVHIPGKQSVTLQLFERGAILYDPSGEVDRVPGLPGPCYPAHIDQGEGLHLLLSEFAPAAPTSSPTMAQNVEAATTTLSSIQSAAQAILVAVQHIQSDLAPTR